MIEHDSALIDSTSLLPSGEVCLLVMEEVLPGRITDVQNGSYRVVGDSRLGKEGMRECGRSVRIKQPGDRLVGCLSEVRATILAKKQGNACGAKGGRKADV